MRSSLIFGAIAKVPNRYLLAKLASKAVREFHKPGVRIEETANEVFLRFGRANPIREIQTTPELSVSPPLSTKAFSAISPPSKVFMLVPPREDSDSLWEEELVRFA